MFVHAKDGKLSFAEYRRRVLNQRVLTCDRTGRICIVAKDAEEREAEKTKNPDSKAIIVTIAEYMRLARAQGILTDHVSGLVTELFDDYDDAIAIDHELPPKETSSNKRLSETLPEDVPEPKSKAQNQSSSDLFVTLPSAQAIGLQLIANEYEMHDADATHVLFTGPKWGPLELEFDLSHLHEPLAKGFLFKSLQHDYETSTLTIEGLDDTEYQLQIGAYSLRKKQPQ